MKEIPRAIFNTSCEPPVQSGELPMSDFYEQQLRQGFQTRDPEQIAEAVLNESARQIDMGDFDDSSAYRVQVGILAGMALALEMSPEDFTTVMVNELMAASHDDFGDRQFLSRHAIEQSE